ncbi:hypothetical protein CAPTEDRAFT_194580 [Capitella teleta]|uniref:G-protein coupled receptors family 1 profile domain-containing protein n=1 Tax=Capitella teleta TaxID=283909 RepID=R7TN09_CAPTE|nr:hypothetical protein CAPTEDRAFT_194580 [Capitella teleta]|eukprot:ELT94902.1 hypothetical protein CAPTEDRAFT_194580 [Capitella teleta]
MDPEAAVNSTTQETLVAPPVTLSPAQIKECNDFYIITGVFVCCFVVLGVVGNSLTVYVFQRAGNRTSTMYLISNLAIVDALVSLMFLPVSIPPTVASLATFYIAYVSNMAYTLNQISIFFITILVWQRPHTCMHSISHTYIIKFSLIPHLTDPTAKGHLTSLIRNIMLHQTRSQEVQHPRNIAPDREAIRVVWEKV